MAYDYEKAKAAYESLTPEQQQQYVDRNKNNATVQQFARDYAREKSQTSTTTTTPTPNYQNQGAGNYVYNEKTWFYENQTDTSKNTVNQWIAPRPETRQETIKETPIKQNETVVSTDTKNNQTNTLTPLSNSYYQQTSDEALNTIKNNLNQYRQTNPEYFTNYEDFKKNFSYDLRNDEQKNVLDTWYKWYEKGLELSATPVTDLYTQYQNGQISLNDLESLRVTDPTKYGELTAQINKGNIISAYDDDKGTENLNIQEMAYQMVANMFNSYMSGDTWVWNIFAEYEEKMNDPEMTALSDQCTEYQNEIDKLQDDIATMSKAVEKEYEGTWASRSKINAIIADRTYELQLQLRTANSNYNKVANQYNNRMQQYQQEYTMKIQEYQLNMQARNQQMNELGFAMDLMNFETNEQKQEREWNYWVKQQQYTNGDINSSDYSTRYKAALKSVENLLSQYEWIPMVRSAEQMAQDVLKAIDEWSDLGTELTKINKQIQQKPEYKQIYNATFGTTGASSRIQDTMKIWDIEWVKYNGQRYTAEDFNKKFSGKISYTPVSPETMSTWLENFKKKMQSLVATWWAIRKWWCWEPVNDYLKSIWSDVQYDNELSTKLNSITPWAWPKVWSIAIWDGSTFNSPAAKEHGHVGIVTAIDEKNWKITVLESNWQAHSMGMWYGTYNMANVTWYFDPTAWYGSTESSTSNGIKKNYVETRVWLYDKYINEWTAPTDAKLKALWDGDIDKWWQIFDAEVQDYMDKTWAWTLEKRKNDEVNKLRAEMHQQDAYKDYSAMKGYYEKIKNATNNKTATPASDVSLLFAYMKMLDPKSIVRESEFATAQNMGSLPTKWHAQLKSAVNWEKLTDSQRTEILKETETLMDSATYLYNNLLDDYTSMINYWWDASKLGKKWSYITSEYINKYWNWASTSSKKWVKRWNTTQTATTNGSGIQSTNFYQTYANTAPASNQKYYVNGVLVEW